jgi:hypothetical protein
MANWHRVRAWDDGTRGSRDRGGQKATPLGTVALAAVIGTLALFSASQANAAGPPCFGSPGTIFACDVFLALEDASVNDIGASTSPVLFIGADNVVPNGFTTSGFATSSDNSIINHPLLNASSPAFPNQISTGIGSDAVPYDGTNTNLLNSWTLTFTNGSNTVVAVTPSSAGFSLPPFANSVTVTGGTTTPTVSWAGTGDGAFVQILSKSGVTLYSAGGLPATGSSEIPSGIINTNSSYVVVVAEAYTHDGTTNTAHYNEAAISRALFDYTVSPTAPPVPINIPMIDSSGVFHFNMSVIAGVTTYIDPEIATGYIYAIGAGNPDFASVTLPTLPDQTGPYEIEWDGGLDTAFVSGGEVFDFTGAGVASFEVAGIDVANGLSPTNPTAFVTALTFEGTGMFTGTMTPISVNVPEPSTWAMMLIGLAGLGFAGYRTRRVATCKFRRS